MVGGGCQLGVLGKCAIIYGSGGLRGTINFHFWESHSTLLDFVEPGHENEANLSN